MACAVSGLDPGVKEGSFVEAQPNEEVLSESLERALVPFDQNRSAKQCGRKEKRDKLVQNFFVPKSSQDLFIPVSPASHGLTDSIRIGSNTLPSFNVVWPGLGVGQNDIGAFWGSQCNGVPSHAGNADCAGQNPMPLSGHPLGQ